MVIVAEAFLDSVKTAELIYKCKIGGGLVIDIPLPPKFTLSDAKRLYAFLQTQVDDEGENKEDAQ